LILWIGSVLFASTNVDDIFVLLTFFADPSFHPRQVVVGQFLGMAVLIVVSLLAAAGARAIPLDYVGLLGFVPVILGATKLVALLRRPDPKEPTAEPEARDRFGASKLLAVAGLTIANGSDNVGAYVPLFATRTLREVGILVAVFLVLTGIWCLAAHRLVHHPRVGAPLRRYGHVVLPFALIALGVYILSGCGPLRAFL
jgi:cadmium resistance protein CadD (predicted permease)